VGDSLWTLAKLQVSTLHNPKYVYLYNFRIHTVHLNIIKVFYSPTDAQVNCLKNNSLVHQLVNKKKFSCIPLFIFNTIWEKSANRIFLRVWVYMFVCVCIYIYIQTYIYIYIHTYLYVCVFYIYIYIYRVAQKNVYTLWHEKYYTIIITTVFIQKQNWYERCPWILDSK